MKKEKIIEIFLKNGLLVDLDSLEYFSKNPEQVEFFLNKLKNVDKPSIIKLDLVKDLLEDEEFKIKEIGKKVLEKNVFSVDDISKILLERYEKIKSFFSYRMDLVNLISINKVTEKTKKFSLIGMIREVDKKNKVAILEDFTGEISVFFKTDALNHIVQDEVIGMVCEKVNDKIEVLNVLWPDIPLKRNVASLKDDVYCLFVSDQDLKGNEEKILKEMLKLNYKKLFIFLFLEVVDKKEIEDLNKKLPLNSKLILISREKIDLKNIFCFLPPTFLLIEDKVALLLCDGRMFSSYKGTLGEKTEEIMLALLKKRHLDPIFIVEKAIKEDCLIIEPIPDIFVSFNFGSSGLINYKGTTIISSGFSEKIFWIVNLKTRESLKINLT